MSYRIHFRRTSSWIMVVLVVFLGTFLVATPGWSQEARGTIVGKVTDPSGAVVPNASVQVTNKAMGTRTAVVTNEVGLYQAPYLIPGLYQITVQASGFKKSLWDNLEVRVNDRIEVDITLELGASEQTVTVTAETPLLETASASLGQVVDGRRIAEMPIPHGNPYFLIGLAAGVSFTRDPRLDRPFEPTHIVGYTMDGTRANRSDITLDGAPSTATANPGEVISSYVPPADIVAEFKVQTATFDASFGQTEGGVTNISLKSGTNSFHGTAYYAKMVPELFANDFFANANRIPRADFTYNRWGGSLGGPVLLPKLYNGRNKTFFMWGYEGIKEARPRNNGTPTVPTEAMKNGDFSALLAVGPQYQIYNPFTRRAVGSGRYQQDPFTGNIIPPALFNPAAKKILDTYFPKPRTAGNPDGSNNYQRPELMEKANYGTHSVRVDHAVSDKQRLFVRASWYDRDSTYNNYFDNLATGQSFQFISRAAVLDDVFTLTPTTVLNVRYGYNRFIRTDAGNPENHGFDLTSVGFAQSYNDAIPTDIRRFPRFDIPNYQGTGVAGEYRPVDTHSLSATLQKAIGKHFLKTGMEFRAYRENDVFFANNQTGQFNFGTTWTRGPLDNSPEAPAGRGQSVAAFLLGLPESSSFVARSASYAEQSTSWGFFLHDDWKVNARLTLNLGLRWEFENPMTERYNRSVRGLDFNVVQPFEAQARTNYARNPTPEVPVDRFNTRGGLTFAGVGGLPRGLYETPKLNLMPRIGLAYRLNARTVLRAGYGVFFGFLGERRGDVVQSGFSRNTPYLPTLDNGLTFLSKLDNPFPNGILEPVGTAQGTLTFAGQSITFFNQKPSMPYMQRWQLGLQRELGAGFVVEASYVGNRGTHIELSQNLNVTPQQYLSKSPVRDNTTNNYLSANLPNPFVGLLPAGAIGSLTGSNLGRERLLRLYPQFDSVTTSRHDGYSWYHSMQLQVQKRFSGGYTLNGNYTFSKFMQATEVLNQDDPRPYEVISDLDRPHRLTMSAIYEFPFGRGRRILANARGVVSLLVSGWQISGIYAFQSGAPLGWGNNIFNGDVKNIRLPADQQTVARWLNTQGFVALRTSGGTVQTSTGGPIWVDFNDPCKNSFNAATCPGTPLASPTGFLRDSAFQLVRNVRTFPLRFGFIRGDTGNNYDFSIIKNTGIAEGKDIQFKVEFLNAFNHPMFASPNAVPDQASFGQVVASNQANYPRRIQLSLKFLF